MISVGGGGGGDGGSWVKDRGEKSRSENVVNGGAQQSEVYQNGVDYGKLNILLGADDRKLSLVEHIYAVQGGERRRIDYKVAASAIGVSPRTVGRYIARLSALKVLKVYNGTIQLAPELIS